MSKLTKIIFNNNTFELGKSRCVKSPKIVQDVREYTAKDYGMLQLSFTEDLFLNGQDISLGLNNLAIPVNPGDRLTSSNTFSLVAFYEG